MITVRGTGRYTGRPDTITLTLTLSAQKTDYERASELASGQLEKLRASLQLLGMPKDSLKTADFQVSAEYDYRREEGENRRVFAGYRVAHTLTLDMELDTKMLGRVLGSISGSGSKPEIAVRFGIRDTEAVRNAVLADAARNARARAEALAAASGVRLGRLVDIRYRCGGQDILSDTAYHVGEGVAMPLKARSVEIEPTEIHLEDSAEFVWELQD